MSKMLVPSLDMRSEPPNSRGGVLHFDAATKSTLVQFRGQTLQAHSQNKTLAVGDSVSIVECPRNSYWCRKVGISWYAKPLTDWVKAGHKAQATLEYFLRFNKKYSPFKVTIDENGEPILIEELGGLKRFKDGEKIPVEPPGGPGDPNGDGFRDDGGNDTTGNPLGDFDNWDDDGDGFISLEEFLRHYKGKDGENMFKFLDLNGDGKIDRGEFGFMGAGRGAGPYQNTKGGDPGTSGGIEDGGGLDGTGSGGDGDKTMTTADISDTTTRVYFGSGKNPVGLNSMYTWYEGGSTNPDGPGYLNFSIYTGPRVPDITSGWSFSKWHVRYPGYIDFVRGRNMKIVLRSSTEVCQHFSLPGWFFDDHQPFSPEAISSKIIP